MKILLILTLISLVYSLPVINNYETLHQIHPEVYSSQKWNATASESDVKIFFHNQNNVNDGIEIDLKDQNAISETEFSPTKDTIFIIHGWQNDHVAPVNDKIKSAYLSKKDLNIFIVDWSAIAKLDYVYASSQVKPVGEIVGALINILVSNTDLPINRTSIVGHSLGAHVAGVAGNSTGGLVKTIVGLDPALPGFLIVNKDNRLDTSDAEFVQVIHTCAGELGFDKDLGHADYWPNGGYKQPGCNNDVLGTCRHSRAYLYFAESIISGNFVSKKCNDYDEFESGDCQDGATSWMGGIDIDTNASGNYYLETNDDSPFAKG